MDELKPCPFCGGEAEVSWYARGESPDKAGIFIECATCSASGEGFDIQGKMPDREEYTTKCAIAAWNRRAAPAHVLDEAMVERGMRGMFALAQQKNPTEGANVESSYPEAIKELREYARAALAAALGVGE